MLSAAPLTIAYEVHLSYLWTVFVDACLWMEGSEWNMVGAALINGADRHRMAFGTLLP